MSLRRAPIVFVLFLRVVLPAGAVSGQIIIGRLLDGESMQPVPGGFIQLLDPVVVEAERMEVHLRNAGLYRRQERGVGQFITREDTMVSGPMT